MTFIELHKKLTDSTLFTHEEADEIIQCCGKATIGNAVIACEVVGIELTGSDIDVLIETL